MTPMVSLSTREGTSGQEVWFSLAGPWAQPEDVLQVPAPVTLEVWDAAQPDSAATVEAVGYHTVTQTGAGTVGERVVDVGAYGRYTVRDTWSRVSDDTWQVDRELRVEQAPARIGVRLRLDVMTAFPEGAAFTDLRYFAPPILYDHNDLDGDGIEDYLQTQNLVYREDRLNMRALMAYHEKRGTSFALIRADAPAFDTIPLRPHKERIFLQKTDIGSIGVWSASGDVPQMYLRACYPFAEGERSHALLNEERPGWEAFWPAETGETVQATWRLCVDVAPTFIDAAWQAFGRMFRDLHPDPVPLPASPAELTRLRLEALLRYYVDLDAAQDPNAPAGFVMNCHPQDGRQLSNIIQYGFTGQNVLNAYNLLRAGDAYGNEEYIRIARRVIDFFVTTIHIPETGLFYNLYNVDTGRVDFWWTGLLLPLAYATPGESLERLMGPIYRHWEDVIKQLQTMQGSYLRCMSEDVYALLLAYEYERSRGAEHAAWVEAARRYGEFLLRAQEPDGSWYRAYDRAGHKITSPAIWFGTTVYEQKSSTATAIPFLVKLGQVTGDRRYITAACNAGRFVRNTFVDDVKFCGGIHDSMYSKGQLIDNEGILFAMTGLLALYKEVGGEFYRQGAINAARLFASWICLWDIPLPTGSTLASYGFRSTGMGACDTCGAGYVHPFQLIAVATLSEIGAMTGDDVMVGVAELTFHGCNQTVAVPRKDWGYRYTGLQEEGYLVSWCWLDDPVFEDTAFGHRWKGEGNKTCFPWIPAVAVFGYWQMLDRYGTLDFKAIRQAQQQELDRPPE